LTPGSGLGFVYSKSRPRARVKRQHGDDLRQDSSADAPRAGKAVPVPDATPSHARQGRTRL